MRHQVTSSAWASIRSSAGPLLLLSLLTACEPARDGPVVLAVAAGDHFLAGARLALEDGLAAGPIPGLDTILLPEPTNRSDVALLHAEDLVSIPGLSAVVGHGSSTPSLAASQIYDDYEIVQIAPTTTTPVYSQAGPFSFRMVPSDVWQGRFLADAVAEAFPDGARLAVFYVNDDYGRGLRAEFRARLDTDRYPLVVDIPHLQENVGPVDVSNGIAVAVEATPDVVVWLARGPVLQRFLPGLRRELGGIPIYGGDAVGLATPAADEFELWKGIVFSDFVDPKSTAALREFGERVRERMGRPVTTSAILTYDATALLLAALRDGKRTGPEIRDWLDGLGGERPPFQGITGALSFDDNGDVERSYVLRTFEEAGTR
ncbi:MAG TPA: ABC transporter substrate-binding protein [Gemmatimonadota bacterium]|nr:ABC transporter substrate-binding protein [Gemmatimonadota bacterium]